MDKGLAAYYQQGISMSTWLCEECSGFIPHTEHWHYFSAQAHILPKETFKSVRTEIGNRLHLCPDCHNNWDSSWDKASKMKVFMLAVVRIKSFFHVLKENLPPCFAPYFS
jgi:hypothetical protein